MTTSTKDHKLTEEDDFRNIKLVIRADHNPVRVMYLAVTAPQRATIPLVILQQPLS